MFSLVSVRFLDCFVVVLRRELVLEIAGSVCRDLIPSLEMMMPRFSVRCKVKISFGFGPTPNASLFSWALSIFPCSTQSRSVNGNHKFAITLKRNGLNNVHSSLKINVA